MKLVFFIVVLLGTSFQVQAERVGLDDCGPVDLRDSFEYQPRNQKRMSWCYAFTAADMIGHEYGLDKVSAADIALNYNRHWVPDTMSDFIKFYRKIFRKGTWVVRNREHVTGFIKIAIQRAIDRGLCLQSDSPDNHLVKVNTRWRNSKLVSYRDAMDEILTIAKYHKEGKLRLEKLGFYYRTQETTEQDFIDVVSNYPIDKILIELNNRSCKKRIFVEQREFEYFFKGKSFFKRINQQLEKKKLIGLDYHGKVRWKPQEYKKAIKGLHTSFLVGRRFNKEAESCEYLIRDSYGPDSCKRVHPSFDCEQGHFWVKEEMLYDVLVSYSYFR